MTNDEVLNSEREALLSLEVGRWALDVGRWMLGVECPSTSSCLLMRQPSEFSRPKMRVCCYSVSEGSDSLANNDPIFQMPEQPADRTKELVLLMTQHQRRIFSYIYTLVPDRHSAEDILQETSLVICEKFSDFRTGTDFAAWACQIAWWQVRAARTKFARSK